MKSCLFILTFLLVFCGAGFAQSNPALICPTVDVTSPPGIVAPGELGTYTGQLSVSAEKFNLQYKWTVSGGEIAEGQGTLIVKVLQKNFGESLTVTLKVIGLPEGCENTSSESVIDDIVPVFELIAEFSIAAPKIDKPKLDNFIVRLQENPNAQGYIIERFKDKTSPKIIDQKTNNIVEYLTLRSIEKDRLTLVFDFANKNSTQLILVPSGANLPCIPVN